MKLAQGFTLVELMIVVLIVALLAAVAVPNYRSYVLRSHRTVAINAILDLGSREARYYTTNNAYTSSLTQLGYATDPMYLPGSGNAYYSLSATVGASSFLLSAAPVGNQQKDSCGTYTYTDLGIKGMSGVSASVNSCWQQ